MNISKAVCVCCHLIPHTFQFMIIFLVAFTHVAIRVNSLVVLTGSMIHKSTATDQGSLTVLRQAITHNVQYTDLHTVH